MALNFNNKFIQANLHHTKHAMEVLIRAMETREISFAVVCDPYVRANEIPGIPSRYYQFKSPENPKMVVLCNGFGYDCFPVMVSAHVVAVTFSTPSLAFTVVRVYAPPHADIDQYLDRITECLAFVKSGMAVIAGDFNAKHSLWGRGEWTVGARQVLQLVCQHGGFTYLMTRTPRPLSKIIITPASMVTPAMATLHNTSGESAWRRVWQSTNTLNLLLRLADLLRENA